MAESTDRLPEHNGKRCVGYAGSQRRMINNWCRQLLHAGEDRSEDVWATCRMCIENYLSTN